MFRISNTSWAYATADQLWDGDDAALMTPEEYYDRQLWDQMCRDMARAEAGYGECNDQTAWETEQEETRVIWGLPAAWVA